MGSSKAAEIVVPSPCDLSAGLDSAMASLRRSGAYHQIQLFHEIQKQMTLQQTSVNAAFQHFRNHLCRATVELSERSAEQSTHAVDSDAIFADLLGSMEVLHRFLFENLYIHHCKAIADLLRCIHQPSTTAHRGAEGGAVELAPQAGPNGLHAAVSKLQRCLTQVQRVAAAELVDTFSRSFHHSTSSMDATMPLLLKSTAPPALPPSSPAEPRRSAVMTAAHAPHHLPSQPRQYLFGISSLFLRRAAATQLRRLRRAIQGHLQKQSVVVCGSTVAQELQLACQMRCCCLIIPATHAQFFQGDAPPLPVATDDAFLAFVARERRGYSHRRSDGSTASPVRYHSAVPGGAAEEMATGDLLLPPMSDDAEDDDDDDGRGGGQAVSGIPCDDCDMSDDASSIDLASLLSFLEASSATPAEATATPDGVSCMASALLSLPGPLDGAIQGELTVPRTVLRRGASHPSLKRPRAVSLHSSGGDKLGPTSLLPPGAGEAATAAPPPSVRSMPIPLSPADRTRLYDVNADDGDEKEKDQTPMSAGVESQYVEYENNPVAPSLMQLQLHPAAGVAPPPLQPWTAPPTFQISNSVRPYRAKLSEAIEAMGGHVDHRSGFNCACTHLVVAEGVVERTEKYLSACAAHIFIVPPRYIFDSHRRGQWIRHRLNDYNMNPQKAAMQRGTGPAFAAWHVLLVTRHRAVAVGIQTVLHAGCCPELHGFVVDGDETMQSDAAADADFSSTAIVTGLRRSSVVDAQLLSRATHVMIECTEVSAQGRFVVPPWLPDCLRTAELQPRLFTLELMYFILCTSPGGVFDGQGRLCDEAAIPPACRLDPF